MPPRDRTTQAWFRALVGDVLAERLTQHDDTPVDGRIVVLHGATWADYQRLLEVTAERVAYLEGALEIMSPSRSRESNRAGRGHCG